jgi:prepilin-type N-terminal cleavage/methylation domain-containing protein
MKPRSKAGERGFSLTELMVTVTLVGVLAAVGISSFRKEVAASKSSEALVVVQAIRAAEEAYRAENQVYLDVSTGANYYPAATYGQEAIGWAAPVTASHADITRFRMLGAVVPNPVRFRFLVDAGGAGGTLPTPIVTLPPGGWPVVREPWYVIQARADVDNDLAYSNVIATSFSLEVYIDNEGE